MNTEDRIQSNEMTSISDKELDALINDSFGRQAILDAVHTEVMAEVRHTARYAVLRRWARVVAFAFGIPLLTLCFGYGIHELLVHGQMEQPYMWAVVLLPIVTFILTMKNALEKFSIFKV